jgi:hypothetical protein
MGAFASHHIPLAHILKEKITRYSQIEKGVFRLG